MAHSNLIMRIFITTLLALLALTAKGWAGELTVIEAYAPKSLTSTASSASVYVTISNTGPADRLMSVSSPSGSMAMIHESKIVDGVATMDMLMALDVPAGGTVKMSPGGLHIMLTDLKAPLKEGDQLNLVFKFEKAGAVDVAIPVTGLKGPVAN
jgi:periplasmic copper chaperone A